MSRRPNKPMLFLFIAALSFVAVWVVVAVANQFAPSVAGGVREARLAACPDSPNCVSSASVDAAHAVEPILVAPGLPEEVADRLMKAMAKVPRARLVQRDGSYLHYEVRSALFRFVDDLEFLIEPTAGRVQVRSASRVGVSDLGVNRRRVEALRTDLAGPVFARDLPGPVSDQAR